MNKINWIFIIIIVLVGGGAYFLYSKANNQGQSSESATKSPSSEHVIFPSGGEHLVKTQTYIVRWKPEAGSKTTQIFLVNKDLESKGESVSIIDKKYDVPSTGSYQYTVPPAIADGRYIFKIGKATSHVFRIEANSGQVSYCSPQSIRGKILTEGAAGNINGVLAMNNTATEPCQIQGNNFVQATSSDDGIEVKQEGASGPKTLTLLPHQTVFSSVTYPNGPQCGDGTKEGTITFTYQISPEESVTFKNNEGSAEQHIVLCTSPSEKTTVTVKSISTNPPN